MRATSPAAVLLAICALASVRCFADTVRADPNAGGSKPAITIRPESDARLATPVTYESGYKRLHCIIDELSAKTGVTIRCGANKDDWAIRDRPMVVSVRDMPLGKLLETIASSADLDLAAETIKDTKGKSERVYRLFFSSRSQAALDTWISTEREASIKRQSDLWDVMASVADATKSTQYPDDGTRLGRSVAKILKQLGPDAKAKVLAGQRLDISVKAFAKPDMLRDLYRLACTAEFHPERQPKPPTPATDEQIDSATFSIIPQEGMQNSGFFYVSVSLSPLSSGNTTASWSSSLDTLAQDAWRSTGEKPDPASLYDCGGKPRPDHMPKDMVSLDVETRTEDAPSFLSQKVKLELPKDHEPTCAETIAALAKAAGVSIVVEDYSDHKRALGRPRPLSSIPPAWELNTVGDILRKLDGRTSIGGEFEWLYDEKTKTLVGRSSDWPSKHASMIPESLLVYLKSKAEKDGLELDDLLKLMPYTLDQYELWIRDTKDLYFVQNVAHGHTPSDILWHFYARLSAQDKAAARSEAGLPLAKYDSAWVADFVKCALDADKSVYVNASTPEAIQKEADQKADQSRLLTDPEVVRSLTLKIVQRPVNVTVSDTEFGISLNYGASSDGGTKHTYYPLLQGKHDGEAIEIRLNQLYSYFPVYSPKREAEVAAKGR